MAASWNPRRRAPQLQIVRQDARARAGIPRPAPRGPVVHRPGRVQPREVVREGGHHLHRVSRRLETRRLGLPPLGRSRPAHRPLRRRQLCVVVVAGRAPHVCVRLRSGGLRGRRGPRGGDRRRVRLCSLPLRELPRALLGAAAATSASALARARRSASSAFIFSRSAAASSLRRRLASRSRSFSSASSPFFTCATLALYAFSCRS